MAGAGGLAVAGLSGAAGLGALGLAGAGGLGLATLAGAGGLGVTALAGAGGLGAAKLLTGPVWGPAKLAKFGGKTATVLGKAAVAKSPKLLKLGLKKLRPGQKSSHRCQDGMLRHYETETCGTARVRRF